MPYTRCPACATGFRISASQLSTAGGQVRCGRCGARFDALDALSDDPSQLPSPPARQGYAPEPLAEQQTPSTPLRSFTEALHLGAPLQQAERGPPAQQQTPSTPLGDSTEPPDLGALLQEAELEPFAEQRAPSMPLSDFTEAPDLGALLKEAEPEPLVERQAPSAPLSHASEVLDLGALLQKAQLKGHKLREAGRAPVTFPEGLSDFAASYPDYEIRPDTAKPRLAAAIAKGLGILALILILALQLAWFERGQLVYSPQGRVLLGDLCSVVGCDPPPRLDLDRFEIVNRSILPQQQRPGVLDLQLEFVNQADFPQPYPRLRVTLLSQQWEPTAQRTFSPEEYLAHSARQNDLMEPQERIRVTLELVKPETGWAEQYRLDFL